MPTIKQGYWVRVVNGQVNQVWDTTPPAGEDGWNEAVEIFPDMTENREYISHHTIDITKVPHEIVWHKVELTVDDRKGGLIGSAKGEFQRVVNEQTQLHLNDNPAEIYDSVAVKEAQDKLDARLVEIAGAVTHEDLDALL
jgi:hypothetical protein